jgi:hypothetical protein
VKNVLSKLINFLWFGVGLSFTSGVSLILAMFANYLIFGEWINSSLILGCVFGGIITEIVLTLFAPTQETSKINDERK